MTHDIKYIADCVLQQHGYIALKDTYTMCYKTHHFLFSKLAT